MSIDFLMRAFAASLLTLALASPAGAATNRYVDDSGSNAADCAVATQPCKTIDYALDAANSGDTIEVGGGSYAEAAKVGGATTIEGADFLPPATGGPVIIDGGSGVGVTSTTSGSLSNLTLRGNKGGLVVAGGAPTVDHVTFDDTSFVPVRAQVAGNFPATFTHDTFSGNGPADVGFGLELDGHAPVELVDTSFDKLLTGVFANVNNIALHVEGSLFSVHGASGFVGSGVAYVDGDVAIEDSRFSSEPTGVSDGVNISGGPGTIRRSTFTGLTGVGVDITTAAAPMRLEDDLITGVKNEGVKVNNAVVAPVLLGDTVAGNGGTAEIAIGQGSVSLDSTLVGKGGLSAPACSIAFSAGPANNACGAFTVTADPIFAKPGDFSPGPGSPVIDQGNPQTPAADERSADGAPRALDGDGDCTDRRDIGAFERAAAACTAPPQPTATPAPTATPTATVTTTPTPPALAAPRLTHLTIVRRGRRLRVRYTLDRDARVTLRVVRHRTVARATRTAHAGRTTMRLRQRLSAGRYRVVAVARAGELRSQAIRRTVRIH